MFAKARVIAGGNGTGARSFSHAYGSPPSTLNFHPTSPPKILQTKQQREPHRLEQQYNEDRTQTHFLAEYQQKKGACGPSAPLNNGIAVATSEMPTTASSCSTVDDVFSTARLRRTRYKLMVILLSARVQKGGGGGMGWG